MTSINQTIGINDNMIQHYDDCNVYCNTGALDRRRPITKYVSQHICGRHVKGGVIPQEIQTSASHTGEIMKPDLLEKLQ
jgi:hypothetical protein